MKSLIVRVVSHSYSIVNRLSRSFILFSPLSLLGPPILILISIPLAWFAAFTTFAAFATLLVRVSLVYIDLGLALVHSWLFVRKPRSRRSRAHPSPSSPVHTSPSRLRRRQSSRSSLTSNASSQDLTMTRKPPSRKESIASLVSTCGPNRDYEGVGGWRLSGDGQEEALWIGMNSRLELPAAGGERNRRHHNRSLTSGSQRWSWSPEAIRMSPVQSRARTPTAAESRIGTESYFPMQPHTKITESEVGRETKVERTKSSGGSSVSSAASMGKSGRTSVKQAGHV